MSEHFVPHILYRWDEGHPHPAWDNPHYTNLHDKVPGIKIFMQYNYAPRNKIVSRTYPLSPEITRLSYI